eukprot:CAMPEP_0197938898 /NCGR_PEP_ID=MMETSP1439-20131203/118886_1 /TAXON_ID=66791 /ORGANISM="Gonyaulax spinifera, Strain CCMP409" /LENGTH=439 /DNA_ID=CAMNT_0043561987 /DNA_START=57 /DNA_END=1376 /DNA_ORIENTATION=+
MAPARKNAVKMLRGQWHLPFPITIVEGSGENMFQSESGDYHLELHSDTDEDEVRNVVRLTVVSTGLTASGVMNGRCSRIAWGNGAVWSKEVPQQKEEHKDTKEEPPAEKEVRPEAQHEAMLWCCGAPDPEEVDDEDTNMGCCSIFSRARTRHLIRAMETGTEVSATASKHAGRMMPIEILCARGLRNADWNVVGKNADAYCVCEIVDQKGGVKVKTPIVSSASPVWNYKDSLLDYIPGESVLKFTVWDKDPVGHDMLGSVTLQPEQIHPDGFEGELQLEGAGKGVEAFLTVDVAPLRELHGRRPMFSPMQEHDIVQRVNDRWDVALLTEKMEESVLSLVVRVMNRRLRNSLLTFASPGWVNALQVLLDEEKDPRQKKRQISECLHSLIRDPLAEALAKRMNIPLLSEENEFRLQKLLVGQVVREIVEVAVQGVEATGLA